MMVCNQHHLLSFSLPESNIYAFANSLLHDTHILPTSTQTQVVTACLLLSSTVVQGLTDELPSGGESLLYCQGIY